MGTLLTKQLPEEGSDIYSNGKMENLKQEENDSCGFLMYSRFLSDSLCYFDLCSPP